MGSKKQKSSSQSTTVATPQVANWLETPYKDLTSKTANLFNYSPTAGATPASALQEQAFGQTGQQPYAANFQNALTQLQGLANFQPNAVTAGSVAPNIQPGQVTPGTVNPNAVQGSTVEAGRVTPTTVTPGSVTGSQVTPDKVKAGQLAGIDLSSFMNPYEDQVADRTLADLERARGGAINAGGSAATAAGAFGGSRHGIADAETNRAFADTAASTLSNLRYQGYQNAQNRATEDINRTFQADLSNQGTGLQGQLANQQNDLSAKLATLQAQMQAGIANQGTNLQGQLANQDASLRAGLANQGTDLQAGLANQGDAARAALANQGTGLTASLANQDAALRAATLNRDTQVGNRDATLQTDRFNADMGLQGAQFQRGIGQDLAQGALSGNGDYRANSQQMAEFGDIQRMIAQQNNPYTLYLQQLAAASGLYGQVPIGQFTGGVTRQMGTSTGTPASNKGSAAATGALSGAATGTSILPGWGTVIGGAIGGGLGYISG